MKSAKKDPGPQRFATVSDEYAATASVPFSVGSAQTIGKREDQEDAFLVSDLNQLDYHTDGILAVVADGVGGMSNGQVASGSAVRAICSFYNARQKTKDDQQLLLELMAHAQKEVRSLIQSSRVKCASTLVCAVVREMQLSFLSLGDSRIYLYRGGGLIPLNREHVVGHTVDEASVLAQTETPVSPTRRKAITSYLGKEELSQIDRNTTPIRLMAGDRVLLMSDGIFGTLTDDQIISCIAGTAQETANAMIKAVEAVNHPKQDNATCVVITCKTTNE